MANSQKAMRLLINKVVPRSRAMLRRRSTGGEEKLTEKGDEGWPKVEGRSVLHCRKAQTKVLPKASYFWGQRAPLTRKFHERTRCDIQKRMTYSVLASGQEKAFCILLVS